ncbi:MAG: response regulator [Pseudomonadota bacterium]
MSYTLLVEDNQGHARLFQRCLQEVDDKMQLCHIRDGQIALDFFQNLSGVDEPPTLVVLDLKLPKVDGFQLLRQIKVQEKLQDVPVVVLTTSGKDSDRQLSYEYGAREFWSKPLAASTLRNFLNKQAVQKGVSHEKRNS